MASSIDCRNMTQLPVLKMVRDLAAGDMFVLSLSKDRGEIVRVERVCEENDYGTCCVRGRKMTHAGGWAPAVFSLDVEMRVLIAPTK